MEEKSCLCAILGKPIHNMKYGLDEAHLGYVNMKLVIARKLSELIGQGITGFISNAEWGFPLMCCEIILGMQGFNRAELHLIIPHEEFAAVWTDSARERWFTVNEKADSVRLITHRFHTDCFRVCDKAVIDRSKLLFTDDMSAFAAQYAEINNKQIIYCNYDEVVV